MHSAPVADPAAITALAQDLTDIGYTTSNIAELLGPTATAALDREQLLPARLVVEQSLAANNRLAMMMWCFMLAEPINQQQAQQLFATLGVDGALALGILRRDATGHLAATIDLSAYATDHPGDMWVASDQTAVQLGHALPADHILGVGKASLTLAQITPRAPVATALDIGTGCGIQALHLLTHAEHVTITDISDRAMAFAIFNIMLNGPLLGVDRYHLTDRVSAHVGNMLEPVAGQRFELVVTNPPFVIAPVTTETTHVYRETGHPGDQLVQDLIGQLHTVLDRGAQAVMLANWEIFGTTNWHARLATWPDEALDLWAIQRSSSDPAQYAEMWLRDSSEHLDPVGFQHAYHRYLTDFADRGVTQIGFGWLWFRHRQGTPPLHRFEYLTGAVHQPVAAAWEQSVTRHDAVTAGSDSTDWPMAHVHIVAPEWVTYEQYQRFGTEHPEILMARSGTGFGRHVRLDTATAAVLGAADGELTAGQLVGAVSGLLELDDAQTAALQDEITVLYVDGFLEVFEPGSPTG